jgi:hypothetical protein
MNRTTEQRDTYYYAAITDLPTSYYSAVEERCEHLEELACSTLELLQDVIKDFYSPALTPLMGTIVERLYSVVAFMETELASLPSLNEHK